MATQERLYTADDLWDLSVADDHHYELDEGALIEMSPTGDTHGELVVWLTYLIFGYVNEHDLGIVSGAETGYQLSAHVVRAPDIGFIAKARLTPLTGKFYPIAPDLAVEVVSPSDTANLIRRKTAQYLRMGTRLVWVVYPDDRLIDVYQPNQSTQTLEYEDTLSGGEVLPGFSLPVRDAFKKIRE